MSRSSYFLVFSPPAGQINTKKSKEANYVIRFVPKSQIPFLGVHLPFYPCLIWMILPAGWCLVLIEEYRNLSYPRSLFYHVPFPKDVKCISLSRKRLAYSRLFSYNRCADLICSLSLGQERKEIKLVPGKLQLGLKIKRYTIPRARSPI